MAGVTLKSILRMAAPAAIFFLLPGVAMAEVCEKNSMLADLLPALSNWIESSPQRDQLRQVLTPSTLVTAGILVWLVSGNTMRSTVVAACWFILLAGLHAATYFSIDLADPYYQSAIKEGCVENSPYRIFLNLAFAAAAVWLTTQRMKRQKEQPRV